MTLEQKRKQIISLFGTYSKRLEKLYDDFIHQLSRLAIKTHVSVKDMLTADPLFHFNDYPELRQELNSIFADYFQNSMLAYKAGITDGVSLAYTHDKSVLTGFSILSDEALRTARKTAAETFLRTRLHTATGLNLSHLVWNYAQQAKSEFEVAISNVLSDGLSKGTSAADLARAVRQYLNYPDMMYRRYHRTVIDAQGLKKDIVRWRRRVIDKDGRVRFVEEPLEKVGMGHYRSARKNSERLMRTEINMAYHRANSERWQKEPFVIGIWIDLSPQHPITDMCDELAGRYPKDFPFFGWHPQCLCMSNPITIQGEEKKEFYRRLAAGEDMSDWHSKYEVKDIPDSAKKWIKANRDKFISAGERGKLGYIWRENKKYLRPLFTLKEQQKMGIAAQSKKRIKTEAEKADIQRRWNERKANNEVYARGIAFRDNLRDFPEVKTFGLNEAIAERDYKRISSIVELIRPHLKYERSITPNILLDSVMRKKYGDEAVEQLYSNAKRTIKTKVTGSIEDKIKKLRFEADWVVKNRSFATVKEVAAYYEREAVRLENMLEFERIKTDIVRVESRIKKYGIKSVLSGDEWYGDIKVMQRKLTGLESYKTKLERMDALEDFAKTSKSPVIHSLRDSIRYAIQQNGIDANVESLLSEAEKNIKRLQKEAENRARKVAEKAAKDYQEKMEKLFGKTTSVDDLKKALGSELPKTLEHLQKKIDNYVKMQGLTPEDTQTVIRKIKEVLANGDFGMNVPRLNREGNDVLESLFSSYFKSQIETGTGQGAVNKSWRMNASRDLFGCDLKKMSPKDYEKYGFLMDKDILAQSRSHIASSYWNNGDGIQVRFKKDRVIATFTTCDSLDCGLIPSLVTDPRTSSLYNVGSILRNTADHTSVIASTRAYASSYIELQYHGKVTLDCIESIFIPDGVLPKLTEKTLELLVEMVGKKGIILYSDKGGVLMRYIVKNGMLTPSS